jgi:hypothetical protein
MNRNVFQSRFLQPGRLYAPQSRKSLSENVLCAESIGIARVITGQTQKFLSSPVVFMHRPTSGTGTRSIGRIDANKQNTVLLGFTFDSVEHSAICPRRHSFTKTFTSDRLLSSLHVVKRFHSNHPDVAKRQLVDSSVDQVLPFFKRSRSALTAWLSASDLISALVPFNSNESIELI